MCSAFWGGICDTLASTLLRRHHKVQLSGDSPHTLQSRDPPTPTGIHNGAVALTIKLD